MKKSLVQLALNPFFGWFWVLQFTNSGIRSITTQNVPYDAQWARSSKNTMHHDFLKYRIDTTAYGTIPSNFDPLFDGKRPFHKSEILFLSSSFNKKNQNMFWLDKIKFCQLCFLHCNNEQFKIWSFIHP